MKSKRQVNKLLGSLFWLLPLGLFMFQAVYTKISANQMRLEEAIESIRSVFWFQNHLVWNGGYTNLGWYAILAVVYNFFGFTIYSAKFVKLGIYLLAIFSLAALLKKYLGKKSAILPLVTIGLSPTLIYLNSLQISHGIEVSYFLICLYLITKLNYKKRIWIIQVILGVLLSIAAISYPAFLYYLPLIIVFYIYQFKNQIKKVSFWMIMKNCIVSLSSFFLFLSAIILYIKNSQVLLNDTNSGLGLFRGGGRLEFDRNILMGNLKIVFSDLFKNPISYYFEPLKAEFSDIYPVISVIFVFVFSIIIFFKNKNLSLLIGFIWICFLGYLVILNLFGPVGLGGMRRETIIPTLFYMLFIIIWKFISNAKKISSSHKLILVVLSLLFIHHIFAYPQNLKNLSNQSKFGNWLTPNSEFTLKSQIRTIETGDLIVNCEENSNPFAHSRCTGLSINYSLIAGECLWNRILCHQVIAIDSKNKKKFLINLGFWGEGSHAEP